MGEKGGRIGIKPYQIVEESVKPEARKGVLMQWQVGSSINS